MNNRYNKYGDAERHYRERMSIYEDEERTVLKQSKNTHGNKQRRTNLLFILPVIIIAVVIYPKIVQYYENNNTPTATEENAEAPDLKEVVDYIDFSKCTEMPVALLLKAYAMGLEVDKTEAEAQLHNVEAVLEALNSQEIPNGFEEYNEYQMYVLATDIELLKVTLEERSPDMENYFDTMVVRRNSLAGHRKNTMKAVFDKYNIAYTENENGSISIEYFTH